MWEIEENFKIKLGGIYFIDTPDLVVYKDESLFKVYRSTSDGILGIDFDIYNQKGEKIAVVSKGRIYSGNKEDFEIKVEMDRYTAIEKLSGRTICDIRKRTQTQDAELEVFVELYTPDGFLFQANPNETNLGRTSLKGVTIMGAKVGIKIG